MNFDIYRVVISGTFRRDRAGLERLYRELVSTGCQVISPRRLDFDDEEFVRDTAEQHLSIKTIQDNHLVALTQADMMWLHAPKGYIGTSGAFEVGYALAKGIPVFAREQPGDHTIREYVTVCPSVYAAKEIISALR